MKSFSKHWLASVLILGAVDANAQAGNPFNPFAQPGDTLLCRVLPTAEVPPGMVVLEFDVGTAKVDDRLIRAGYDSAGTPTLVVMTATEKRADADPVMHGFVMHFPKGEAPSGLHMIPNADGTTEPTRSDSLSADALSKARVLAVWLWDHRCGKGPVAGIDKVR